MRRDVNPFTAMLAAPSLWKRPIKVPNLKSLRLFSPCARAREQNSVKTLSTESRLVIGPSDILFASVYVCRFQPGNLADWASEGVNCQCSFVETAAAHLSTLASLADCDVWRYVVTTAMTVH